MTKKSAIGDSLKNIRPVAPTVSQPAQEMASSPQLDAVNEKEGETVGTVFRMVPGDYYRIKQFALDQKLSIQELLERGINTLLAQKSLAPIKGVPNKRKRRF